VTCCASQLLGDSKDQAPNHFTGLQAAEDIGAVTRPT
jgi:hypothetical protein